MLRGFTMAIIPSIAHNYSLDWIRLSIIPFSVLLPLSATPARWEGTGLTTQSKEEPFELELPSGPSLWQAGRGIRPSHVHTISICCSKAIKNMLRQSREYRRHRVSYLSRQQQKAIKVNSFLLTVIVFSFCVKSSIYLLGVSEFYLRCT